MSDTSSNPGGYKLIIHVANSFVGGSAIPHAFVTIMSGVQRLSSLTLLYISGSALSLYKPRGVLGKINDTFAVASILFKAMTQAGAAGSECAWGMR